MLVFFPLCGGGGYTRRSTNWPAPTARPSRAQYTFDAHRDAKVSERHLHASAPQSMLSPCTPSAALPPLSRCRGTPVHTGAGECERGVNGTRIHLRLDASYVRAHGPPPTAAPLQATVARSEPTRVIVITRPRSPCPLNKRLKRRSDDIERMLCIPWGRSPEHPTPPRRLLAFAISRSPASPSGSALQLGRWRARISV